MDLADAAACREAGVAVVRRRSGGGAVLLDPGDVVWIDVVIPVADRLWQPDIAHAFWWLGDVWAGALRALAPICDGFQSVSARKPLQNEGVEIGVNTGPMVRSAWSDLVCFAGLGPGEVTIDGRKAVGMSQRRTRGGALFQTAAVLRWDVHRLATLLALPDPDRIRLGGDLRGSVAPLTGATVREVEEAFLRALEALAQ